MQLLCQADWEGGKETKFVRLFVAQLGGVEIRVASKSKDALPFTIHAPGAVTDKIAVWTPRRSMISSDRRAIH